MNLLADVLKLVSKLPPEGLSLLSGLVRALLTSDDPMRAVKRAAAAAASEKAADKLIAEGLRRRAR